MPSNPPTRTKPIRRQSYPNRKDSAVYKCILCDKYHPLRFCKKFQKMSLEKKEAFIERHYYCINCLAKTHDLRGCTSMDTCRKCDKFHHTLLHPPDRIMKKKKPFHQNSSSTDTTPSQRKPAASKSSKIKPKTALKNPKSTTAINKNTNTRVIIEAIKSLAQVLCNDGFSSPVA